MNDFSWFEPIIIGLFALMGFMVLCVLLTMLRQKIDDILMTAIRMSEKEE